MSVHAVFSPSSIKRKMICPGSHLAGLLLPDPPESEYAAEGTRLHEVAAEYLVGRVNSDATPMLAPYLWHCTKLIADARWHGIEQRVRHSDELFGTADFLAVVKRTLHVVDLKTGRGVQVDPTENAQLLTYAWLALVDNASPVEPEAIDDVVLTIAQPTIDGPMEVRSWACGLDRIVQHGAALLAAIDAAKRPGAPFVPGDHCRWCKVKPACPALTGMAASALAAPALAGLSPAGIADWLDKADLLQTWIDGLRERAHQALRDGYSIPGYALKPKRATRCWADEGAVLEYARERKIRIFQPLKLLSPAMAEKAYPKGLPTPIAEQIVSVSSGTNLVRDKSVTPESIAPASLAGALSNLIYRI